MEVAPEHRATLAGYRQLVVDGMLAHLSDGRTSRYLTEYLPVYPAQPGKGLRGALVLAINRAMGGRTDQALPFAIGIELLHNAFLVHDDIIDGSRRRRDAPTLPVRCGTGLALCVGDALSSYTETARQSGKNWGDDVLEGKRSLPVIHFLATAPEGEDRDRVVAHLRGGRRNRRRADAHWFVNLLRQRGSLAQVDRFRLALTREAHTQLAADTVDAVDRASVDFVHAIV